MYYAIYIQMTKDDIGNYSLVHYYVIRYPFIPPNI